MLKRPWSFEEAEVTCARQFHEAALGQLRRKPPPVLDADDAVVGSVNHQRWLVDSRRVDALPTERTGGAELLFPDCRRRRMREPFGEQPIEALGVRLAPPGRERQR